jgi:predicted transcriptional regulator
MEGFPPYSDEELSELQELAGSRIVTPAEAIEQGVANAQFVQAAIKEANAEEGLGNA